VINEKLEIRMIMGFHRRIIMMTFIVRMTVKYQKAIIDDMEMLI
jgi:hypothetical protein